MWEILQRKIQTYSTSENSHWRKTLWMQLNVENHLAKTTTSFSTINFTLDEGLKSTANMRKPSVNNLLWLNTKISTQALSFGNSAYVEKKAFCMTKSTWGNGLWPSRNVLSAQCENTRGPLWGDIYHGFQVCEESSGAVFHISLLRTLAIIVTARFYGGSHLTFATRQILIPCISHYSILREDSCLST